MGIDLREHDIKFEEDNWEWPVGGAWGVGWQVMLDGLEITQFTYFQQCGGAACTSTRSAGRLRTAWSGSTQALQDAPSIYDVVWAVEPAGPGETGGRKVTYGDIQLGAEQQWSAYSFDYADVPKLWEHLRLYEAECLELLERGEGIVQRGSESASQRVSARRCG